MKTGKLVMAGLALAFLSTCNPQFSTVFGQGALTPPGGPAPTMITLSQIEPRTPISTAPFTITQPGSYYLTTNLTVASGDAISINTNGVTLDLSGFTLSSTESTPTGDGVLIGDGMSDITIFNGHIRGNVTTNESGMYVGSGFGYGIAYPSISPSNVRVTSVSVSGCLYNGIAPGLYSTVVESCMVLTVGGAGVIADIVSGSTAFQCGNTAIDALILASDCLGYCTGDGDGVDARTINNCFGYSTGDGTGINANEIYNCYGESDGNGDGISGEEVNNSTGQGLGNGNGIGASIISDSWGYGFTAIEAEQIAIGCVGFAPLISGSIGIKSPIANSCYSNTGDSAIGHAYNMP